MLILSRHDVEQILTMELALLACREAYIAVAAGESVTPQRHQVHVPAQDADMLVMSGSLPGLPALGLKVVSVYPGNRERGLENTLGAVLLLDPDTGVPTVLMDGTFLTAIRTGAGSGVATELLALPGADSVAILGTGGMAWHQLEAMCAVRPVRMVTVWNRTRSRAEEFASTVLERWPHLSVQVTDTAEAAVRPALIICAATSSPEPVVRGEWLRPGAHVNLTGSHRADWREADDDAVLRAEVIAVDSPTAALVPGDLGIPIAAGLLNPERVVPVGRIAAGQAAGRREAQAVTLFKSVGLAAQDLAAGTRVLARARELGLGQVVEL